jgi:nitrate/TMAO reductase-like tetraheme cytochrome c subunit
MKNPKRARKVLFISLLVLISVLVILQTANVVWNTTDPSRTCASCHEIRNSYEQWNLSAHRGFDCKTCHGTALSNGMHSLKEKVSMLNQHYRGNPVTDIRMDEKQVEKMVSLCAGCHQNEFAKWMTGGHSMRFSDVFLNKEQNQKEPANEHCLRCHGMFYEGSVTALVSPLDTAGPWKIISPDHKSRYAIPCLACHSIHTPGQVSSPPDYANPGQKAYKQPLPYPKAGFYEPYEKVFFRADRLPALQTWQKERKIFVSEDPLARICSQCHAPDASHQSGTSDDKTPMGVHEGLSCMSCHQPHTNDAMWSCRNCHPAFSNCGLDVEKMNTTFASPDSPNDIHTVSCADCHPGLVRTPLKPLSMN